MSYTENHLVEQPAIQLMQHELGWDVVNCYGEPSSLTILHRGFERQELRRSGREVGEILNVRFWILNGRGRRSALQRLNPDLPVEAIEGAVEEVGILNFGFWMLNGRGKRLAGPCLNPALTKAETNREIVRSGFPLAVGSLVFKQSP